jgi:hypothetical protein
MSRGRDICPLCTKCAWVDNDHKILYCFELNYHPEMTDFCHGFERETDEKLTLTPDFLRVVKLLKSAC